MKLRIEQGSLKARLSEEELKSLLIKKRLEETYHFSDTFRFELVLLIKRQTESLSVGFRDPQLTVSVSESEALRWEQSNMIGVRRNIVKSDGRPVTLVVEKDLPPRKMK